MDAPRARAGRGAQGQPRGARVRAGARLSPDDLLERWSAAWPAALAAWSPYVQLRAPRFLVNPKKEGEPGMHEQIAAIRMGDLTVLVNTTTVTRRGLEHLALPILAHEIGHHVHVPGSLTDHARLLAVTSKVLQGMPEGVAMMCANLYADLHVNDRLQRRANIDMAAVYRRLREAEGSRAWTVYTRAYEHLWRLPKHSLCPDAVDETQDGDALLAARIVRAFAGDWLRGARRFAAVMHRHLLEDADKGFSGASFGTRGLEDTRDAAQGGIPDGLVEYDPAEVDDDGFEDDYGRVDGTGIHPEPGARASGGGQARAPWTYADLMRRLGISLDAAVVTARYYRERALPHLLPFPTRRAPRTMEPLAEGWEVWEAGDPLEELDILGSVMVSPVAIPGVTTMRRVYGETPGADPGRRPIDLDIYVDCSGSMPDPSHDLSYLALAGVILALSALRAGARVQATLWSGPGQTDRTPGFTTDEAAILKVICGYISGGTSFPLPLLRQTWEARADDAPPAHIVVISDDGVDTILANDERGVPGAEIQAMALAKARAGGTLVLNLPQWRTNWTAADPLRALGWHIHAVTDWADLVAFARAFVRDAYGE